MVLFVKIILNNDTFRFAKFDIREIASRKKFDTLGRFKIVSICMKQGSVMSSLCGRMTNTSFCICIHRHIRLQYVSIMFEANASLFAVDSLVSVRALEAVPLGRLFVITLLVAFIG